MKSLVLGILAHVDAGKTTLSEGMLYTSGTLRQLGRVDHKDAFLDTYELEKERGITIFSKQARFEWEGCKVTLLDTPGHVDFSTEMERTLQVLDYAILVVSGSDGVQGHTETLWRLLKRYSIPTFIFVNKMDLGNADKQMVLQDLHKKLSDACVDFSQETIEQHMDEYYDSIAMCEEAAMNQYLEKGKIEEELIGQLIAERKVFPCYFGSALRLEGVEELLKGLKDYSKPEVYPEEFGARVYKIARDEQNNRLTYMKVTGGMLKARMSLSGKIPSNGENEETGEWEEKINQIRLYSGNRFVAENEVAAGTICAVTGLNYTFPGQCFGEEKGKSIPMLEPVLTYCLHFEEGVDSAAAYRKIKVLSEEDPQLHIVWNDQLKEVHIQLMGEVQTEILRQMIRERFGYLVSFGEGSILYKETIARAVEGVGHFEPLRHYAEVHLLMEPGEVGSGLQFSIDCSEDDLDKNWQRLIYTHLEEKVHLGVLTGAPITDMKITLIAGKAHMKHTEGGDFRQATYRAIRQGLKSTESVLLEPFYNYTLAIPPENVGRAMNDLQRMEGSFETPELENEYSVLKGKVPVATMRGYMKEVHSYTHGKGRLTCELAGYYPCHNQEEIVEQSGYDSEGDLENPTCSVFCAHGSGFLVPWNQVREYMHVQSAYEEEQEEEEILEIPVRNRTVSLEQDEAALESIWVREFGEKRKRFDDYGNVYYSEEERKVIKNQKTEVNTQGDPKYQKTKKIKKDQKEYLLVDGYNIIFSWDELNQLAQSNLDAARVKLMEIMCNYQGYRQIEVIVVFDAYKVKGNLGSVEKYHNIHVVFTKEAETADMYIEKVTHEIGRKYKVTVATSDGLEQVIIMQQGAYRMSATDLKQHVEWVDEQISSHLS